MLRHEHFLPHPFPVCAKQSEPLIRLNKPRMNKQCSYVLLMAVIIFWYLSPCLLVICALGLNF